MKQAAYLNYECRCILMSPTGHLTLCPRAQPGYSVAIDLLQR